MTITASPTIPVPSSHRDLLIRPICGVLTTIGAQGEPQSTMVWVDFDGECARFNTTLERQKGRNLATSPKASLLIVDPDDTARFIQVRGDVELSVNGAVEHLDSLARKYTGRVSYYGFVYPSEQTARETRVIGRLRARRITCDAIHA